MLNFGGFLLCMISIIYLLAVMGFFVRKLNSLSTGKAKIEKFYALYYTLNAKSVLKRNFHLFICIRKFIMPLVVILAY